MTALLNNLTALVDTTEVSLDSPVGSAGDLGSTITVGSETMAIVAGIGTPDLLVDRGASPAVHAVGDAVSYSAGGDVVTPGLSAVTAVDADPGATMFSTAAAPPGDTLTTFLYLDSTAVTGGLYAWDGSAYVQAGSALS